MLYRVCGCAGYSETTGPDSANGRASASGAGVREFDTPGRAIPKALKMVPVATLLDAQHIRQALALLSLTTHTTNIAQKTNKTTTKN